MRSGDMNQDSHLLSRLKTLATAIRGLSHTFRFIVGAVYALREARALGHRDRVDYGEDDRNKHLSQLLAVINALDAGLLLDPTWKAGFYYNAAIMRIDACYERFLKAVEEAAAAGHAQRRADEAETEALARHAETALRLGSPLVRDHLRCVRKEVNKLKHVLYGQQPQHAGERVEASDVNNALKAVAELVSMMERPEIKALLATRFGAPPPA